MNEPTRSQQVMELAVKSCRDALKGRSLDEASARAIGREIGAVVVGELLTNNPRAELVVRTSAFNMVNRYLKGSSNASN